LLALDDKNEYSDKEDEGYILLYGLYVYLKKTQGEIHGI
jgi:hypothetical protein